MWSLDQQHHHHPGTCQKCKFSAPCHTCSVQTPGGSLSDCVLRSLPGDSDTCPCPALLFLLSPTSLTPPRGSASCVPYAGAPRDLTCSHGLPTTSPHSARSARQPASQRQPATVPAGPCSSLQDPSPHLNGLSEGTSAHTHPHWSPVSTPHEKTCSARDDSHLREVLSAPTCLPTSAPSTATSFTQLSTSPTADGLITPFSSILKATLIDGQAKLWDLILSVNVQFAVQEECLAGQVCGSERESVRHSQGPPSPAQAQSLPFLPSPTCGGHHCSRCSFQHPPSAPPANRGLKKHTKNLERKGCGLSLRLERAF